MALSSNLYAAIVQRLEKILAQTAAPKVPEWPSYCNFRKVTQNPNFLKKCKAGTKGNVSKLSQKVALVWKAQKHCRKCHYPVFNMHLNCKDWKRFWRKQRLQKFPNGQVMAVFARSLKSHIFLKGANGGPREIFQNSARKYPLVERLKSTLAQKALSSN